MRALSWQYRGAVIDPIGDAGPRLQVFKDPKTEDSARGETSASLLNALEIQRRITTLLRSGSKESRREMVALTGIEPAG